MCGIMLTTKPWSIANPLRKPSVICHSNAARFWPDEKFASPFNFYRHKAVADAMKRGPAAFGNPYSAQESKSSVRKPLRRDISNCPITADADIFDFEIHFARLVYTKAIFSSLNSGSPVLSSMRWSGSDPTIGTTDDVQTSEALCNTIVRHRIAIRPQAITLAAGLRALAAKWKNGVPRQMILSIDAGPPASLYAFSATFPP